MKGELNEKVNEARKAADWAAIDVIDDLYRCLEETMEAGGVQEMDDDLLERFRKRLQDLAEAVREMRAAWK